MQLPLTADWLVPLGAGVIILAALILLWLVMRKGRPAADGSTPPPVAPADPEPVAQPADVPPALPPTTSFAAVPAHWSGGSRPAGAPAVEPAAHPPAGPPAAGEPVEQPRMAPPPDGPPSGPVPVAPWTRAGGDAEATDPDGGPVSASTSDRTGSSRTVAAAVAQAFAVRAAAGRQDGPGAAERPPTGSRPERAVRQPEPPAQQAQLPQQDRSPQQVQPPRQVQPSAEQQAEVRDRLLAVLLHDPAVAVDATIQLDACLAQLARLSHAVRHERAVLRDVLHRLAGTGLRTDQLARLAGMPVEELQALLAPAAPTDPSRTKLS